MSPRPHPPSWPLLLLLGLVTAARASLPDDLARCRAIGDGAERLRCYDGLRSPATVEAGKSDLPPATAPGVAPAGPAGPAGPATAAGAAAGAAAVATPSPEALFGVDAQQSEEALRQAAGVGRLEEMESRIASVRVNAEGKPVFTLANGQAWRQLDSPAARLQPGDVVRIRRASLGSYLLLRPDGGRGIRVRRIE
jgi:hypothetical protein